MPLEPPGIINRKNDNVNERQAGSDQQRPAPGLPRRDTAQDVIAAQEHEQDRGGSRGASKKRTGW